MRTECEKRNIGWAIWEDHNSMALFDSTAGTWVEPLLQALIPLP